MADTEPTTNTEPEAADGGEVAQSTEEPQVMVQDPPKDEVVEDQPLIEDTNNNDKEKETTKETEEVVQLTDAEKVAAGELPDDDEIGKVEPQSSRSIFTDEGKWATMWLLYTAVYWTLVVWIPTLLELSFVTPGFFSWCVGAVGLIGSFYTLREGKYPSGATKEDKMQTNGIGRWTTLLLTGVIIIDFNVLVIWGMFNGSSLSEQIKGVCHLIHIFWTSLFFYGKFRKTNPEIATFAFFIEWFDVAMSCAVVYVLHNREGADDGCFDLAICVVYFAFIFVQLSGWMFPMMILESWGTQKNAKTVSTQLFFLDLCTDCAVILAVLIEGTYKDSNFIMLDIVWKTFSVIRSFSYYLVYQLWLDRGRKVFKRTRGFSMGTKQ